MRPVFIVGCQRSGSTLLGSMLGSHPEIICLPEAQFIVDLMPGLNAAQEINADEVIARIKSHWRFRAWNFDLDKELPSQDGTLETFRGVIEWVVGQYAETRGRAGAQIWVDHEPYNVSYLWRILKHFPDAHVVHIIRDGRAVAASIMPLDWGPNEIHSAARYWKTMVGLGYAAGAFLDDNRLYHLRYEDLLIEPEVTMRRLADFIGVRFDAGMLSTTGLCLPRFTKYQHDLVGKSLDKGRIDRWRKALSIRQIEIFEQRTNDLLEQLGYERLSSWDAPKFSRLEWAELAARDVWKKVTNRVRYFLKRRAYMNFL